MAKPKSAPAADLEETAAEVPETGMVPAAAAADPETGGIRIVHEETAPGVWRDCVFKPGVA